mmetsp:Transcript_11768/g.19553  ORF Transcript_11768/g.19553 Transcript_11768/m.19553 type:complete len:560 (-) Transcript_11768:52-1731(-)|eukprot:CAMPEP_0119012530 /NCGR_PEP_ID=MMETSP1176-20130426/6868_1 /TAXON_ID=265551 /ORGANISM="Synedropsis recta cf, Strain CCMP1620" /LENGTH=559 /DNA_ID=CAMNT_0006965511 /DNA_START=246 /DNA_END=1925 /DNA_ORIENTATION=+
MGNTPVKIGIRLDHSGTVEAGGVLKGRVYLSMQRSDQQARGIHLVLKGEELSEIVRDGESNGDRERRREVDRASVTIHNLDVPLTSFPTGVAPRGQYEYPFEWPLPANLPSTMHCQEGDSSCSVRYQLTAYLDNSASMSFLPDYSSTETVIVAAASATVHAQPLQMDLEEFNIKSCCANRGTMTMGWDADTIVAAPKGAMNVGITGKNDSIVALAYLSAKVVETVSWSANGHSKKNTRVLTSNKVYANENPLWKPLLHIPSRRDRRRTQYESTGHEDAEVWQNRCVTQLNFPVDVRDSHLGNIVKVRHSLVITAVTPGACCVTSPESSVLITIQRRMPTIGLAAAGGAVLPEPSAPFYQDEIVIATAPMEEYSYQDPPMAVAEILPDNWTPHESEVVVILANSVIPEATRATSVAAVMPSAPTESLLKESHQIATSLAELQTTLMASKDPTATLQEQLNNPVMVATVENLSPHEVVETLKSCSRTDPEYVLHARLLASTMVPHFYCRHVMACLWSLPQSVRFQVLKEIAPLASDIASQKESVERELDATELMEFRSALM